MQVSTSFETVEENKPQENPGEIYVTDSKGRKLKLKEPELFQVLDVIEELGNKRASNSAYMNIVESALWVVEIDGTPLKKPQTTLEIKYFIQQVGNSGHLAVQQYFLVENAKRLNEFEEQENSAKKSASSELSDKA